MVEPMLMIAPPVAFIARISCLRDSQSPSMLTETTREKASTSISSIEPEAMVPAAFTATSSAPIRVLIAVAGYKALPTVSSYDLGWSV